MLTSDHTVLPATTHASPEGMSHACLYFQLHSIIALWPVFISCPAKGRKLSWPGVWLHTEVICGLFGWVNGEQQLGL